MMLRALRVLARLLWLQRLYVWWPRRCAHCGRRIWGLLYFVARWPDDAGMPCGAAFCVRCGAAASLRARGGTHG